MVPKNAILVFQPPAWPVFLTVLAAALLAVELAWLLWAVWRGRSVLAATGMTLAVLGGPLTALAAAAYGGAPSKPDKPSAARTLVRASLKATLLGALAAAILRWHLPGAIAAITVCAIVWALRAYGRTTSPTARQWKAVFLSLRVAALLLLGLWALGPQLAYTVNQKVRRTVLIGVDLSQSMQRRDVAVPVGRPGAEGPAPISRAEAVQAELIEAAADLERVAQEADVVVFGFSTAPRPIAKLPREPQAGIDLPPATGRATAIGDAAQEAADPYLQQGAELGGIILLTDGCNNTAETVAPEKFATRMALSSVPVYTVGVGSEQVTASTRNLNVRELAAPDQIEAFNRLPIRATVEAFGLKGRRVRIRYRFGNEANAPAAGVEESNSVQTFTVDDARAVLTAQFVHVPLASGFHRLTVQAECLDPPVGLSGQFVADKLVQVVDRGLRVLYVEGQYRYEVKFITQALLAAQRFSVDRRILLQPLRPEVPPPLSESLDDWLRYHAILLGDIGADSFTPKQWQIIKDLVGTYGKGLCMIGGSKSFGRGGWGDTALADVMPVDLKASTEQIESEIRVVPTADGLTDPILDIGKAGQDVAAAWKELSPMPGANKLVGVKPGAAVLAESAERAPLVVVQNYGAGRSLAVAFDTTWLWVTTKDTGELQRRFWRQVMLYLCSPKGNVWITTDKPRYDLDRLAAGREAVEITAGVEDTQGSPMPDAPVEVTLTSPAGKTTPLQLVSQNARRAGRLSALQLPTPGTYVLKINASVAGRPLTAESRFDVQRRDVEAAEVLANFKLLQRVAEEGGGQFVPLKDFRSLLDHLHNTAAQPKIVPQPMHFDLGGYFRWPVVIAILALLVLEWGIRKRKGLV